MWLFPNTRRVLQLQGDFERLERDFKKLELEWNDTYDKLRRTMARIVKSRAIIEAKENGEETAIPGTPTLSVSPAGGLLSPHQKEIQQAILRRRAGG